MLRLPVPCPSQLLVPLLLIVGSGLCTPTATTGRSNSRLPGCWLLLPGWGCCYQAGAEVAPLANLFHGTMSTPPPQCPDSSHTLTACPDPAAAECVNNNRKIALQTAATGTLTQPLQLQPVVLWHRQPLLTCLHGTCAVSRVGLLQTQAAGCASTKAKKVQGCMWGSCTVITPLCCNALLAVMGTHLVGAQPATHPSNLPDKVQVLCHLVPGVRGPEP